MIRRRQRWLTERQEQLEHQLEDMRRYNFDPEAVEVLRQRLADRLATATPKDRRFILESVGAKVIVQPNGAWEFSESWGLTERHPQFIAEAMGAISQVAVRYPDLWAS